MVLIETPTPTLPQRGREKLRPLARLGEGPHPQREQQVEPSVGVFQVDAGDLADPAQPVVKRVEVDVQVARGLPEIAVPLQVDLQRLQQRRARS
jgi:hypothetical protein